MKPHSSHVIREFGYHEPTLNHSSAMRYLALRCKQ